MTVNRIIITGPECSGKSSLASFLCNSLNLYKIHESAVDYLNQLSGDYSSEDVLNISIQQDFLEKKYLSQFPGSPLICDTSFLVLYIWSIVRYGSVDPWIKSELDKRKNELFLLCKPDLDWVDGPFRENPHDRDHLFNLYLDWLLKNDCEFFIVQRVGKEREQNALDFVKLCLNLNV